MEIDTAILTVIEMCSSLTSKGYEEFRIAHIREG
jgi:hypothetical protein